MDPSNSLFFRPTDSEYDLQAWFDWILERTRECRSTKLLRPVFHEEFFEAAWDVQIVCKPKLRRDYSKKLQPEIKNDDLAEKRPQLLGHRRLCVCQSSFLLFTLGCRPSTNVDAPFDKNTFIDLSLNVISNYGTQEKFFFIRIGRCSEIGSGELWMTTEHGASARSIHERISQINQRESERRRAQGIKINLPTISSSVLKSRAHRERSQTQNTKKLSNLALSKQQESEKIDEARKVSSNSTKDGGFSATKQQINNQIGQPDSRSCLVDSFSCLQSIPEKSLLSEASEHQQNISSKKNSIVGLFTLRLGAKMSTGSSGKPADNDTNKLKAPHIPKEDNMKCDNTSLSNVPIPSSTQSCHRNSIVSSVFGVNKTRRNSLTNSSNNLQTISVHHQKVPMTSSSSVFSTQPSYDCAEDYMTYDPDEQHSQCGGHSLKLGSVGSRVSTCALTRAESRKSTSSVSGLSSFRQQALSNCSFGFHNDLYTLAKGSQSYVGSEYLEMNIEQKPLKSTANDSSFPLCEAQSYISNHSEGCVPHSANQTSISVTHPQAHSPGSSATSLSINADSGLGRMEQNSGSSVKLSQLLHPSASSSPPNYLKKTVGQKTKSIKNNEFDAFSTPNETLKNTEYAISDDKQQLCINSNNLLADVRKRAHSVGSKTWIKPSLKKFPIPFTNKKCNEATDLRDSEHVDSRRNTFEAKSTCSASSSFYPNSTDDHVEIDFDRDESQSIDSIPSLHSRHSSVSVHCSMGIRYTIDFLPSSHRGVGHCNNLEIKEGNDKKSLEKICLQKNCLRDCGQIRRKRSVPEMFQQQNDSNNTPTQQRKGQQQIMLESDQQQCTYCNNRHNSIANDHSLALRCLRSSAEKRGCISTNLSNVSQTKRSPPRAISSLSSSQLPTSQSMGSSSGISSRSNTESSTSALIERETRNNKIPELPIAEDDNDDYVMLNPIKSQRSATNPQQLTVRSICTILESSPSPSSSLSSDGDSRNRAGKLSTKSRAVSEVPSIPLDDCAILMLARRNTRATGHSPVRGIIANDSPVRARLSVSSRSRSPSLSPHQPIGKFSSSTTPQTYSTACSYFPSLQQRGSPSPTRRKISSSSFSPQEQRIIFMDPPNDKVQRKFTCPNLSSRSQPLHSSQKSINKESEDCNYAFISGQEI
ncbi:IRS-type PTB domain-containing protein [Meloidogyne graminicola]|uniref:IRS-type PTB domain-containing protein n=1 Tax=Meloidogyne graminicola TaxID=189291 RepID=A0A8T0A4R3_9BILA|nr:IRS-type PTB domain-containing protein [Meloidogyne graminicola]